MDEVITCDRLKRTYPGTSATVVAVNDVSLGVHAGEMLAIVGPSGAGKTTLLGLLGGVEEPDSGQIFVGGRNLLRLSAAERLALRRRFIGFVFQSAGLVPLLNARENVALALELSGTRFQDAQESAHKALEQVGLGDRAEHRPHELSGGEQQRVALARAMVKSPLVLLADEPTGQLDSDTGLAMFTLLREMAASGTAVIMATHDDALVEGADRVLGLADGRIRADQQD